MKNILNSWERLTTAIKEDKIVVEHLHRYALAMEYVAGKTVLDLASGEGYGAYLLSAKARFVYGVDISPEAILHSQEKYKKGNIEFLEGCATQIPLENNSIDIVVSFETIEHHGHHREMMAEFKRVLRKDGIIIISSPDKKYYTDIPNYHNPFHVKELYAEEFLTLLSSYFVHVNLLKQGTTKGSFIYNTKRHNPNKMIIFEGSFDQIQKKEDIYVPEFNLIIASDEETSVPSYSFFETKVFDLELQNLKNSTTYKIGKLIIAPYKFFCKLIKRWKKAGKLAPGFWKEPLNQTSTH